ncbi:hypothetical protein AcV5_002966 [Taiwanofungus camphoratus]|nr:hypothetical protein AcV5_002966 [Antrodia cinnamomea]
MSGPFPAPDVIAHDQAGLLVFGNQYRITRAFWIMSLALMVYDYCLTFNDELRYMWEGRFVWTRVLFWMNRYWPMANLIFDNIILGVAHPSDIEVSLLASRSFMNRVADGYSSCVRSGSSGFSMQT